MLTESEVNIHSAPLEAYDEDYVDDGGDEGDDELEEVDEETFDAAQEKGKSKRTSNYTEDEDLALIKAWESVSIDAFTGSDQSRKKYWQRIEDKFLRLVPNGSTRTMR